MPRHGYAPITPISAALTLVQWTHLHGRPPLERECCGSNGLHWWPTYYKKFGVSTYSAVLECAFDLASGAWEQPRALKRCLNYEVCGTMILDEGRHIRFCATCRQRRNETQREQHVDWMQPAPASGVLRQWGMGRDGGYTALVDWRER